MIHTFKAVGQPMMLDVGSGAVHAIDETAYDVLSLWNDHTPEEIVQTLSDRYSREELEEVVAELRQLEELGALNAPDDYRDIELQEPGVVKAMCLHAAHDCNLRCKYCFAATGDFCMGERKLLPYEVGKAALDWLVEKSGKRVNLEVDFFGGEPLMNFPVIKRLVEYGRSIEKEKNKHFKFTTTTNCVAMTDEIMDFLNKEMDNVVISMDGRPEVHDRMRPTVNGKGSYELIAEKAKPLRGKAGPEAVLRPRHFHRLQQGLRQRCAVPGRPGLRADFRGACGHRPPAASTRSRRRTCPRSWPSMTVWRRST